jgi:hypothetical protein
MQTTTGARRDRGGIPACSDFLAFGLFDLVALRLCGCHWLPQF